MQFQSPLKWTATLLSIYLLYDYSKHPNARIHDLIGRALRQIDPEDAHVWSLRLSSIFQLHRASTTIPCTLLGKRLDSPIGIAAGYSKNGESITNLANLGFGIIEIGSITPCPQEGNEKPRVFRIVNEEAVINRYGFNSDGHDIVESRIKCIKLPETKLFGVNLGKNKYPQESASDDYIQGMDTFSKYADYLVINISSPNTPGLRALQGKRQLNQLFKDLKSHASKPVLLKVAPDLHDEDISDICSVVKQYSFIKGLIISNTTIQKPVDGEFAKETGGLSGKPLYPIMKSTLGRFCNELKNEIKSKELQIIGCGGITTSDQIIELAEMGCNAVQIYTGMVYNGIGIIPRLLSEVKQKLGDSEWDDIVGSKL
eukprot:NODE_490_length_7774_cov_0.196352.p1 type:complete len:371 gc:universal NODE_490_length_7774_cov_0.196352:3025-1913(-)